ncbi:bifunctional phosphoribosyl-AMP cyclohydrolase/phosphoribosyl-ATP diphosphatase HisIE [Motilimonas cestriensis]|uniref:Histidine biosynthesis bifunctional protein HisIE n=1 Tax=Motilimonas cestriensis TaxID=2742685 RepID=A0ABS8WFQ8_9GAMM|nr:bifunctional phosphoribosyl-AMP cyclohydrolase/phosphoribosyl-ATP diphosphatase HisIE [Motilimonas cestriensis]MCE2596997.1 bifunctional phosphoribosyl-AMP cyclohydrolase/phosphoribosyl-ATP diphosphatase HisIE [Motilimonas cestriensis]
MINEEKLSALDWDKVDGLMPVIVQDAVSAQVLMLGYVNQEALSATIESGNVTFFSRTKSRLWCKGETSGHFLKVVEITPDCDNDTLLITANPIGPTCHLGNVSCFENEQQPAMTFIAHLEQFLAERKAADPSESYTAALFAKGTKRISQKVGEEGVEVALAAMAKDREELICESADLLYHLTVLLQNEGVALEEVVNQLKSRHGKKAVRF